MEISALSYAFKDHPDILYLLNNNISITLSQAAAKTFLSEPKDPIDHFARLLLHYNTIAAN